MNPTDTHRDEEHVRDLLEQAGPRPDVPPEDLAHIKAAFRATWREHVDRKRGSDAPTRSRISPWNLGWAAAAILLVGLGLWWWSAAGPIAQAAVARVEALDGPVTVHRGGSAVRLAPDDAIPAGARLSTGTQGRAALRLTGGASLRLDVGTRARLASASEVHLEQGAVYVDTGPGDHGSIRISTPYGTATDVGTQFEVRLVKVNSGAMRVRVREGLVHLVGEGVSETAKAGTERILHGDGVLERGEIAPWDPAWAWVVALAPPFDLEGRTLPDFLRWVTRETGWTLRYADSGLEAGADSIVLHGSMGDLSPAQAPDVVLPGAGLEHEVTDGVLVVGSESRVGSGN